MLSVHNAFQNTNHSKKQSHMLRKEDVSAMQGKTLNPLLLYLHPLFFNIPNKHMSTKVAGMGQLEQLICSC